MSKPDVVAVHDPPAKVDPRFADWLERVGAARLIGGLSQLWDGAGWFVVDADQRVVAWSEGAEALLGFPAEDVVGEHCRKANRCTSCMRGCGLMERGLVDDVGLDMIAADGSSVPVLKRAVALHDEDGAFLGGIEILRPDTRPASARRPQPGRHRVFHGMISVAPSMHQVFETLTRVAGTDVSVLIRGESGTGKELVARALHAESERSHGPFIAVNCAALAPTLLESELFGHARGAFTGAVRDHKGLFEQADHGTLFLDEIAELPLDTQAKLLRVLESRQVTPVGGSRAVSVDVRMVAATHQSLRERVAEGEFREDLMYRLRVVPLFLPPLRDRLGDVPVLVEHFLEEARANVRRPFTGFRPDALRALLDHRWPGNVRELRNVVAYATAVGLGPEIGLEDLPPEFRESPEKRPAVAAALRGASEADRIRAALDAADGHVGKAADLLGMSRPTFWRKRKKHALL